MSDKSKPPDSDAKQNARLNILQALGNSRMSPTMSHYHSQGVVPEDDLAKERQLHVESVVKALQLETRGPPLPPPPSPKPRSPRISPTNR